MLVAHGAQVGQAVAAVGEHDGQVSDHPAGIVAAAPLARPGQAFRNRLCQAEPVGRLGQQRSAPACEALHCGR